MHARVVLGVGKGALFREASSVQGLKCMQELYLGWEKVSCLEDSSAVLYTTPVPLTQCVFETSWLSFPPSLVWCPVGAVWGRRFW